LECSETSSVLNGWWIMTQNITENEVAGIFIV